MNTVGDVKKNPVRAGERGILEIKGSKQSENPSARPTVEGAIKRREGGGGKDERGEGGLARGQVEGEKSVFSIA